MLISEIKKKMASTYFGLTFPELSKFNGQLFYCVGPDARRSNAFNVQKDCDVSLQAEMHDGSKSPSKFLLLGIRPAKMTLFQTRLRNLFINWNEILYYTSETIKSAG